MTETLEQFTERMSQVELTREYQVGPSWRGHTRSTFVFEGQHCYLESSGYGIPPFKASLGAAISMFLKPTSDSWWTDFSVEGKKLAERIAAKYGADIELDWYQEDDGQWHHFCFCDDERGEAWDKLMRFVYARRTGEVFDEFRVGGFPVTDAEKEDAVAAKEGAA